ncbi:MAG: TetR/AcrR family transcriptional regulator [Spirochaetes bacterium]|nr:TetR/AcrR family transcriptional regulator [Spirochaetota bacterium]
MNREEKSNLLRNRIIEVSRDLFIQQGYSATTMRQILGKTGLTTGSLYNFFENKENILKQIAAIYLEDTNTKIKSFLKDYDPILHYILIIYYQLKASDISPQLTDIWHNAYSLWAIAEMICRNSAVRNKEFFGRFNKDLTDEDWYARSLAINGVLHNIILEQLNKGKVPLLERLRLVMLIAATLFNLPPERIEPSIAKAVRIMDKNKLQFYGISV